MGLTGHEAFLFTDSRDFDGANRRLAEIFSAPAHPTAVVVATDYWAIQLYEALTKIGLRVPDDVALVGYRNTPWCDMIDITLTSVSINEHLIADAVAEAIDADSPEERHIAIPPRLVIRESCGGSADNCAGGTGERNISSRTTRLLQQISHHDEYIGTSGK